MMQEVNKKLQEVLGVENIELTGTIDPLSQQLAQRAPPHMHGLEGALSFLETGRMRMKRVSARNGFSLSTLSSYVLHLSLIYT
jgi:hypothetical protein